MSRELARALRAAGSIAGLARKLGVSPSTVSRWKRKGLPSKKRSNARDLLADYKRLRVEVRKKAKSDRETFELLMKQAGEVGKLPKAKAGYSKRAGPRTSGQRWTKGFNRNLTLDLIDDIEVWGKGLRATFPLWQGVVTVSQYGRGEHRGYGTVYYQLPSPEAGDFAIEATVSTGRSPSKSRVLGNVRSELEDMLTDPTLLVFVHSATLYNYRLRTEDERKSWESAQRRKREQWRMKESRKRVKRASFSSSSTRQLKKPKR